MTILYLEDWKKYPNAIPHHSTTNTAFLRLAGIYRHMGVPNYQMILALHNPDLANVDPYDPDLTVEIQAAIMLECYDNFWYFLRCCTMVPGVAGREPVPFRPNRAVIAMYWLYFNHIMPIVVMGRQLGKSYGNNTLSWWLMSVRSKDTLINLLTKDRILRASTIKQIKSIDKHVPVYMTRQTRMDTDNTEEFTVKSLNNQYIGHLPQRSKKAATNLGRGLTSKDTFGDEGPFQPNFRIALPAAAAASTAARAAAKESGTPYGMILTTTAASKDDPDGAYVYSLLTNAAPWSETYYGLDDLKQLEKVIRKNSIGSILHVNCTFSHRQLGYTDKQLDQWIEDALVNEDEANRDFRNMWTSGSDGHVLGKRILSAINNSKRDPVVTKIYEEGYVIKWYVANPTAYLRDNDVVYGLDPSDAIGKDSIAAVFVDTKSGEVIGVSAVNETNIVVYSRWLLKLHIDNERLMGVIERKSTGVAIIDFLIEGMHKHKINPFTRLYNTVVQRVGELEKNFESLMHYSFHSINDLNQNRKYVGYNTSATGINSRSVLYVDVFKVAIETCRDAIRDEALVTEILGLTVKNGRIDHGPNTHDDLVIAFLLASYALYKGNRLDYYGIDAKRVLTNTRVRSKQKPEVRKEQRDLRERIVKILTKISNTDVQLLVDRYETEARMLSRRVVLDPNETFNINQALDNIVLIKKQTKKKSGHGAHLGRLGNYR